MAKTALTILLIEDSPEYAELVKRWLAPRNDFEFFLEWRNSLQAGLSRLAKGGVDAVLLDLGLQDSGSEKTLSSTKALASGVPIVILSGADAEAIALRMVEEGAQDYINKSTCTSDLLVKTLQFAVGRSRQRGSATSLPPPGNVIGVIGAKGGVGTTTVALNLATVLARKQKAILVEMRPSFGTLMAHLLPQGRIRNLARVLDPYADAMNPTDILSCLWTSQTAQGLRVMFGPQTAAECVEIGGEQAKVVTRLLAGIANKVIVDLPPTFSPANRAVLELCSSIVLVVERDPLSMHMASLVARTLETWSGTPKPIGAVVVNRVSYGNPMPMAEIETILQCRMLGAIPPVADLCLKAQKACTALVTLEPESLAANSMRAVVEALASSPANESTAKTDDRKTAKI